MTPKPESETDPWAAIQRYELVQTNFAYTTDHEMERDAEGEWARWEAIDAARAAEAAQRQQEIAEKDAHLGRMLSNRYDADVVELRAELAAKDETIRQQAKQMATLEAERDRLKAALQQLGDWLRSFSMPPTSTIAEKEAALVFIAAALTPHGQSTNGETR